jgi:alpha-L-fucosidase
MMNNSKTRRQFFKSATIGTAGIVGGLYGASVLAGCRSSEDRQAALLHKAIEEGAALPKPSGAQQIWQDCEVGLIYHFDMPVAAGEYAANNTSRKTYDPTLYNPDKLDTDQWIEAAKAAGAKYAIFTATHFNGFMQWQSDLYPYGVKQSGWRGGTGDVVEDFVNSCHKAGILPGIYFSTHRNVYWEVWGHYVNWGQGKGTPEQAAFNRIAEKMTEELCSRYGKLVQIWYDAGVKTPEEGGPDVLPVFERHQPDSVFYHSTDRADHRWIGNESGYADYPCWATMPGGLLSHNSEEWRPILGTGDPNGQIWSPGMVDVPLRGAEGIHNWFWTPGQDHAAYTAEQMVKMYYDSVGRNSNFIIGEVVTQEGLVPESDIANLAAFGKEIQQRFAGSLTETEGVGNTLELDMPNPGPVDHVVIQEEIAHGERIRAYSVEGKTADGSWRKLCDGQSVGHKRIERFDPVDVATIRLSVTSSVATPIIRKLAVYNIGRT